MKIMMTNLQRHNRGMMSHSELMKKATEVIGSPLTKVEKWFVWTHPDMTFDEIRAMLDGEENDQVDAEFKQLDEDGAIGIDGKLNWRLS